MEFIVKLSENEVNLVGAALGKMPFESVAGLIGSIQKQINEQIPKEDKAE